MLEKTEAAETLADPLAWIDDELALRDQLGLRRWLMTRSGAQGAEIEIDGRRLVNFGSNDYLGLAADPRIASALAATLDGSGWGSGASPLLAGRQEAHAQLERRIAEFEGTEAALVFNSGFAANLGVIPALVGQGDLVFSDELNHASLIDGCRLSRAHVQVYPHCDLQKLDSLLAEATEARRRLIVTDGLFSMDGDVAPLAELADLADRHDAMLLVDEAHATGVLGEQGRGASEQCGVDGRVSARIGTLSKALGGAGGFVCGSRSLVDWIANSARSYVFSTASPAAQAVAALTSIDIVQAEPQRRELVLARAAWLRERLQQAGFDIGPSTSQIVPLMVGSVDEALRMAGALFERGLYVPAIRPPSVPEGTGRLRISVCYHHTQDALERLVAELVAVCR